VAVWRSPGNHRTLGGYNHSRDWLFTNWAQEVMFLRNRLFSPLLAEMFLQCFIVFFYPNSVIKTFRTNLPLSKQRWGDLYQMVDIQRLNSQWLEWAILEDCFDAWKDFQPERLLQWKWETIIFRDSIAQTISGICIIVCGELELEFLVI
jgi:hypothetical protein